MTYDGRYGVIGKGRLARHFCHYLDLLGVSYQQWSRRDPVHDLQRLLQTCRPVLVLIQDHAIESFIKTHPANVYVHCSGSLVSKLAPSAHPLMSFTNELYGLAIYQKMAFITEAEGPAFSELLPGLPNPHFAIPRSQKAFYHSLCVLSGNFTCLLWQKFISELEQLSIPRTAALAYLEQIVKNISQDPEAALTGPLGRGDNATLHANLAALQNDPFQQVYQAFINSYRASHENSRLPQDETI